MSFLRDLLNKRRAEKDLHDEVKAYVDELTVRKIRAGEDPETARRHALSEIGGMEQVKEECRDVRRLSWLDVLAQDVRYGLRMMARHRGVTIVSLLSLGIGIGVNTLIFSFINALVLTPLPYPELDRLVSVAAHAPPGPQNTTSLTYANCIALKEAAIFEDFGCYVDAGSVSVSDDAPGSLPPTRIVGQPLSAGLARAFGMNPILGRWFVDDEEKQDARPVIVISYRLWQRRFGGTDDVLGRTIRLDGEPATIIGVTPNEFQSIDSRAEYWIPLRDVGSRRESSARMFRAVARLRDGADLQMVQSEADAFALALADISPETNQGWGLHVEPLGNTLSAAFVVGNLLELLTVQATVGFVLLIACANVAGLLLAQGAAQHKELSVRAALGAGRWRIVRQLLTHSILLSLSGSVLGLIIGMAGLDVVRNYIPLDRVPRAVYETQLNWLILTFTFGLSFICGLVSGIAPAIQISRAQPIDVLRDSSRSATAGAVRQRLRSAFVVGQVAIAFVLLIGAGISVNTMLTNVNTPIGFDPSGLVTVQMELPDARFRVPTGNILESGAQAVDADPAALFTGEQIRLGLTTVPGVASVGAIAMCPPLSCSFNQPVRIEGVQTEPPPPTQFIPVMPDYFKTLGVEVLEGREFGVQDTASSAPVVVINEVMAQRFPPGRNPLGDYVQIDSPMMSEQPRLQIVGIVPEIAHYIGQRDRAQMYLPFSQLPRGFDERLTSQLRAITYILRTSRPAAEMASDIALAVGRADSTQAITSTRPMTQTLFNNPLRRVYTGLLASFGIAALILATIGIYGVMAHSVSQRTNELGIRLALGARPSEVRRLVLLHGGKLIGLGLTIGVLGAVALTVVMEGNISGITQMDPLTFTVTLGLLGIVGLLACYIPARRASRIDPMNALRHD